MHTPGLIEKYITWPIKEWFDMRRYRTFQRVLRENGMDWGKYDLEEMTKMYHRHQHEINRD